METYQEEHIKQLRAMAPECMALLKSDGSFPLEKPGKLALYGNGTRYTVKGGRGSGDVNLKSFPTVEQGLKNAGFEITTAYWMEAYEKAHKEAEVPFGEWLKAKVEKEGLDHLMENLSVVMPEPEYDIPLTGEGETAVYVLSRLCGEGVDRQAVSGDLYLSNTEIRDILALQKSYPRFLLALNVGGMVDLSPVANEVKIILLLSPVVMTIGDSFADVLLGRAYPSGKLSATWSAPEDYWTKLDFGSREDTRYREGIYVGYRYFDSVGKKPLFPFGYGLGYTEFAIGAVRTELEKTRVTVTAKVKNTGKKKGKEVVQLYASVPQGMLDQPWQTLAAFTKTGELAPGEETEIRLCFRMEELASADAGQHERILDAGDYLLRIGNSSRSTMVCAIVRLSEKAVTEKIHAVGGKTDFADWRPEEAQRRQAEEMWRSQEPAAGSGVREEDVPVFELDPADFSLREHQKPQPDPEALALAKTLSDEELAHLCTGAFLFGDDKRDQDEFLIEATGAVGETTARLRAKGVPKVVMSDGPAGLRLSLQYGSDEKGLYPIEQKENNVLDTLNREALIPQDIMTVLRTMYPLGGTKEERYGEIHEQNCSAIPIGTALAQSWNLELTEACGKLVAAEMKRFGVHMWLAPAMNIQRHPLCGRNFEYYSEDPLLTGKLAAAMVKGVQSMDGCSATLKHFLCNNQETNRFRTSSMVNERTLRDIYARGFEIAVKEAKPHALMTSYNLLNGIHTSEHADLLETLLREEWGYEGMVTSDWNSGEPGYGDKVNKYRKFDSASSIKAGNDVMMPGGTAHYENILKAIKGEVSGCLLTREEAERCAARSISHAWKLAGKEKV